MNVQELLHMLDVLSSKSDHGGIELRPHARQHMAKSAPNQSSGDKFPLMQPPSERCGSGESFHASKLQPPSSEQYDGSDSAPSVALASADLLRVWRSSKHDMASVLSATSDTAIQETHSTSALDSHSDTLASAATGGYSTTQVSSGMFGTALRAAELDRTPPLISASSKVAKFTSVFDAATVFFPDVDAALAAGVPRAHQRAIFDTSTLVQRVIRTLGSSPIHSLYDRGDTHGPMQPHSTTVAVSQDGQEVLWMRDGGRWCSFFIRDIKNLIPGRTGLNKSSSKATLGDSCVFGVELPGRILEFKAETPHTMQLWLVGLLALLESVSTVVSSLRIWRSLAPWLTHMSYSTGTPDKVFDAPSFPQCIENFMQEFLHEHKNTSTVEPLITREPMMAGSFLRRVLSPQLVIFIQTSVMLGDCGLVLADPYSSAEFARCDFRIESGITVNSIEFVSKHGMGPPFESVHLESFTFCMDIKDSFGACHTILLPSKAISSEWEAGVRTVRALPHNSLEDRLRQSVAAGGVRALLKSLDHCKADHIFDLVSEFQTKVNGGGDGQHSAQDTVQRRHSIIGATESAHDAFFSPHAQATKHFSSDSAPAAHEAVGSSKHTASPAYAVEEMQLPSPLQDLGLSKVSHNVDVSTPCRHHAGVSRPDAVIQGSRDHFDLSSQQLRSSFSSRRVSSGTPHFYSQQTSLVDDNLQSLARDRANSDNQEAASAATTYPTNPTPLDSRSRIHTLPPQNPKPATQRSPAASPGSAPKILLHYEHYGRDEQTDVQGRAWAPAAASPSPNRSLVSPNSQRFAARVDVRAGSAMNQAAAEKATADAADRINSAIAGFANFRRKQTVGACASSQLRRGMHRDIAARQTKVQHWLY